MGKIHFDGESKIKAFFKGKGFYVALAVCLVALCGVAVTTFMSNTPPIDTGEEDPTLPSTSSTTDKAVDTPVTGIPDDRSTTAPSETTTTTTATTTEPDIQTGATSVDLFILPLTNEVCGSFSDDQPVYSKTMNDWRVHNGVDFVGSDGQAVKALADGTIQDLEEDPLWGKAITIDHGFGIQSRYCGVTPSVKEGDTVKVGDIIGNLSEIPCESLEGSHLHLEITADGKLIDPINAIGQEVRYTEEADPSAA